MLVHVDFWVAVQLFSIGQGLSTGLYLLLPRQRRAGTVWLALLVLGLTLQVVDYFLSRSGVYYRHRELYFLPLFFSWGFGPLLWGYVRRWYEPEQRLAWGHFGPVALQLLFYTVVAMQNFDTKTWFWLHVHKPVTRYVEYYGAVVSVGVYLGLALRLVRAHGGWPRWLSQLLWGMAGLYALLAVEPLVNRWYLPAGAPAFYLASLGLPILSYALALLGWRSGRPEPRPLPTVATIATAAPPVLAQAPPAVLSPAAAVPDAGLLARLVQLVETDQAYRNPDLTLSWLAQQLGCTPNTVSQLINVGLGQSFSEWVNGCRLAEVERRLHTTDTQKITLLALALDAGFNSKTTFNRVFKEKHGLPPRDYQKMSQNAFRDDAAPPPA